MKLLLNQNLSFKLSRAIADLSPGSSQARLPGLAEADDRTIWRYAQAHGFGLVTQDSDFAEMAASTVHPRKSFGCAVGTSPPW